MASAEFACGQILFGLKQSKLNYVLNETPYSAYITIRKKFLKISKEEKNYNIEDRTDTSSEKDVIIKSLVEKNKTLEILIASAKVEYEELCFKIDLLEKNNRRNEDIIENYIKKDKIKTNELDCIRKVNERLKSDIANICNVKDVIFKLELHFTR